jgi:cytochrome c556
MLAPITTALATFPVWASDPAETGAFVAVMIEDRDTGTVAFWSFWRDAQGFEVDDQPFPTAAEAVHDALDRAGWSDPTDTTAHGVLISA